MPRHELQSQNLEYIRAAHAADQSKLHIRDFRYRAK